MKIVIGSDHAGFALKEIVVEALKNWGHDVNDIGPDSPIRVDYPVYGKKVGEEVANHHADKGIVICGSGIGISIAANKVKGVRAALCSEPLSARLSREHNDANVLALGSRIVGETMALEITEAFLNGTFQGGRHSDRVALLTKMDENE